MDLQTVFTKGKKNETGRRIGRGTGSGSGKTSGKGHKGRNSRSGASRRAGYEGGQMPIYRRVPKRGFTNARFRTEYTIINVDKFNDFEDGATVDLQAILDAGLASLATPLLKVLGNGDLEKKLTVRAQKFSASAVSKIEEKGGTVVLIDARGRELGADGSAAAAPAEAAPEAPSEG